MKQKTTQAQPGPLRYVGDGSYLPFVPARDLSAEEAAQHWATIQEAHANGQRLYVPAEEVGKEERGEE